MNPSPQRGNRYLASVRAKYRKDGAGCVYCPCCEFEQIDHLAPKSRGGSDHPSNLVPACASCNNRKGGKRLGFRLQCGHYSWEGRRVRDFQAPNCWFGCGGLPKYEPHRLDWDNLGGEMLPYVQLLDERTDLDAKARSAVNGYLRKRALEIRGA